VAPGNSATGQPSGAGAVPGSIPAIWPLAHRTNAPPGIISRPPNALSARIASRLVPWFAVAPGISFSSS